MNLLNKLVPTIFMIVLIASCNKKNETPPEVNSVKDTIALQVNHNQETIEGIYETKPEEGSSDECKITLEITKTKTGYSYFLKTKTRKLKGIANFTKENSGEQYLILEGIKWDEYEGDISEEDESDSISESKPKELEIPVGIDASYAKDTLTIQNYGNSMNSYTKLSECGRKYIQLIKK